MIHWPQFFISPVSQLDENHISSGIEARVTGKEALGEGWLSGRGAGWLKSTSLHQKSCSWLAEQVAELSTSTKNWRVRDRGCSMSQWVHWSWWRDGFAMTRSGPAQDSSAYLLAIIELLTLYLPQNLAWWLHLPDVGFPLYATDMFYYHWLIKKMLWNQADIKGDRHWNLTDKLQPRGDT